MIAVAPVAAILPIMSTVMEIESAIRSLRKDDFWELAAWFDDLRAKNWEDQMAADAESGALDFLFDEAKSARQSGEARPWPVSS